MNLRVLWLPLFLLTDFVGTNCHRKEGSWNEESWISSDRSAAAYASHSAQLKRAAAGKKWLYITFTVFFIRQQG